MPDDRTVFPYLKRNLEFQNPDRAALQAQDLLGQDQPRSRDLNHHFLPYTILAEAIYSRVLLTEIFLK